MADIASEQKKLALAAWHDANTDLKKEAAVAKFPCLVEIYALAANFVAKTSATETKPAE